MRRFFSAVSPFTLSLASAIAVGTANAQTVSCNGLMEQAGQGPGLIPGSELKEDCVQININGNLVTPAQCTVSYTYFDIHHHTCVIGTASTYCDFDANRLTISKYSGGGCPQLPDLGGIDWGSLDGWLEALPRVIKSLVCKPPNKTTEESDSGAQKDCQNGQSEDPLEGEVIAVTELGTAIWSGFNSQDAEGPAGSVNPFQTPYEAAQTATPQEFGGALGAIAEAQMGVLGVDFHASILVESFDYENAEESSHSRRIVLWGQLCADGRFDVRTVMPTMRDGKASSTTLHATFDGQSLATYFTDAGTGNLHVLNGAPSTIVRDTYMEGLGEIYSWCTDPFEVPLFANITYDEMAGSSPQTLDVVRHHPLVNGGSFVSEKYVLSTRVTPAVPVSRADYDTAGVAWTTCEYDKFVEFREGDRRPMTAKRTQIFGSAENRQKVVTTLRLDAARPLKVEESLLVPAVHSHDGDWVEWTH